jgi:hypothetical protein
MKDPEVELMEFCWMRGLGYCELTRYAPAFNIKQIPSEKQYKNHCTTEEAAMEKYYKDNKESDNNECDDILP